MTRHPDVQAKAREEMDCVVGRGRLPTLADRDKLPYLNAVISEVLRCCPVVPLMYRWAGIDDMHENYFIPKNTCIMLNSWWVTQMISLLLCLYLSLAARFVSRDPRNYVSPETFDPNRFLKESPELDPRNYVFGFGMRACPGRYFAMNILYSFCALAIATLDVSRAKSQNGHEIVPELDLTESGIT
jgi:cytochrome P450